MMGEGYRNSVLAIIAALNEEEGVGPTIAELRRYLEKPWVLVVDGNSSDRTVEVAKKPGRGRDFSGWQGQGRRDSMRDKAG